MDRLGIGGSRDRSTPETEPDAADAYADQVPVDRAGAGDDDRSADKFCETQRMARTDDEKWLVVDGQRWRRTEPAVPADALARMTSHLDRGRSGVRTAANDAELDALDDSRRQGQVR